MRKSTGAGSALPPPMSALTSLSAEGARKSFQRSSVSKSKTITLPTNMGSLPSEILATTKKRAKIDSDEEDENYDEDESGKT